MAVVVIEDALRTPKDNDSNIQTCKQLHFRLTRMASGGSANLDLVPLVDSHATGAGTTGDRPPVGRRRIPRLCARRILVRRSSRQNRKTKRRNKYKRTGKRLHKMIFNHLSTDFQLHYLLYSTKNIVPPAGAKAIALPP
jgi:hypothetical protein